MAEPDIGGTITYNNGTTAQWFANTGQVTRPMVFNGNVQKLNARMFTDLDYAVIAVQ